jgi:predicted DNA-binding transcriptional regulator YafY
MPINRNALLRYKTIDGCLRNRHRRWTLEALVEACSAALFEYEGRREGVSRRTVQLDLQFMRSEKLGYNAPIVVIDKKYYTYEDPKYSITNIPLTAQDLGKLQEVVGMLRQFKGFSHFAEVDGMISRLQHKIFTSGRQREAVIDFEKNERLAGLEHLDTLYQAITEQRPLEVAYQSFRARESDTFDFHAYLLKEYRNRWFVIGVRDDLPEYLLTLALDRIRQLAPARVRYRPNRVLPANFYDDVIGVSKSASQRAERIELLVRKDQVPYLRTKPLHASQQEVEVRENGTVFAIEVVPNFELERELLSFGESVVVLAPAALRERMREQLRRAWMLYT